MTSDGPAGVGDPGYSGGAGSFGVAWRGGRGSVADMNLIASGAVLLVAALHLYFLVLEMFLWTKPAGRRAFGLTEEFARATRTLAANQGLYNGFLAAGLIWGVAAGVDGGYAVKVFFLGCVIVAGVFGAATASRKILWVQAVPGAVGLALVCVGR